MMFITPIPPTSNEIAATSPSSVVNTLLLAVEVCRIELWLMTLKLLVDARAGGRRMALIEDVGDLGLGGVELLRATWPGRRSD